MHRDLTLARILTFGPVAFGLPIATLAVFAFGADRERVADTIAIIFSVALCLGIATPLLPLPSLRGWTKHQRLESAVLSFLIVSYVTHLTWEFGWLVLRDAIRTHHDAAWSYAWWVYIDGGDARYASSDASLVAIEILSVVNGLIGLTGLSLYVRSKGTRRLAFQLIMATAVVHLYSTSLYMLSEIVAGLPSVDTTSFVATFFKFGLANAPWLVVPWGVLAWGARRLDALPAEPRAEGPRA